MNVFPGDTIGYQGVDYVIDQIHTYALADLSFDLVRMTSPAGQTRFVEMKPRQVLDRLLLLSTIPNLDIAPPPPATIYHHGESYLRTFFGRATVTTHDAVTTTCTVWRYHAAFDMFLQIEEWPDGVRTLAGASVHAGMLEVRPATQRDQSP